MNARIFGPLIAVFMAVVSGSSFMHVQVMTQDAKSAVLCIALALASIFISSVIFARSKFDRILSNTFIIGAAIGFFLFGLDDYTIERTILIAAIYPYLTYQLLIHYAKKASNVDSVLMGVLAAIIILANPFCGAIVVSLEISRFISHIAHRSKKIPLSLFYSNLTTITLCCLVIFASLATEVGYLILGFTAHASGYGGVALQKILITHVVDADIFPMLLLISISAFSIVRFAFARINTFSFLVIISSSLFILLQSFYSYSISLDQRLIFYAISAPAVLLLLNQIITSKQVNWNKLWFPILAIMIVPQFADEIYPSISYASVFLAPLIFGILAFINRNNIQRRAGKMLGVSLIAFVLFIASSWALNSLSQAAYLSDESMMDPWSVKSYGCFVVLASVLGFMVVFFEKVLGVQIGFHKEPKKFNLLTTVVLASIFSYLANVAFF